MTAAGEFRYPEGALGPASLSYHGPIPVLRVAGAPGDIARQTAALAVGPAARLLDYPLDLIAHHVRSRLLARLLVRPLDRLGRRLLPQFPAPHRRELEALAGATGDRRRVVRANTLFDLKNVAPGRLFGCSSLAAEGVRTAAAGPLLARNMDFFPLGYLDAFGLVTAFVPAGSRRFVAVGFPGSVGCFSGMNDAGLAAATHEVFGAPGRGFDPRGVPFALIVRRALEACATIDEAEALFRSVRRATAVSVVLCDRRAAAVLEVSPDVVVRRDPAGGVMACTNHFLGPGLSGRRPPDDFRTDYRAAVLTRITTARRHFGVGELFAALHEVNMGPMTLQSMVFDPAGLSIHLSMGRGPATARPPTELRLADLF